MSAASPCGPSGRTRRRRQTISSAARPASPSTAGARPSSIAASRSASLCSMGRRHPGAAGSAAAPGRAPLSDGRAPPADGGCAGAPKRAADEPSVLDDQGALGAGDLQARSEAGEGSVLDTMGADGARSEPGKRVPRLDLVKPAWYRPQDLAPSPCTSGKQVDVCGCPLVKPASRVHGPGLPRPQRALVPVGLGPGWGTHFSTWPSPKPHKPAEAGPRRISPPGLDHPGVRTPVLAYIHRQGPPRLAWAGSD